MSELFFLPHWPVQANVIPWYAVLLLVALLAGEAASRLRLPRILGWIIAGIALGPSSFNILDRAALNGLRGVLEIAVGLVLFELGQRLDVRWLRRNPWLLATSVLESSLAFAAIFAVLLFVGAAPLLAATAAAIGIATGPAVVLTLVKQLRAQGQVSERMLALTALNNAYAFLLWSLLFAWLHAEYRGGWLEVAGHPLYLIFGSLALAALLAAVTLALLTALGRRTDAQFVCLIALVVLAVSAATMLKVSVVLTLLAYGTLTRAFDRDRRFVSLDFGRTGQILVMLLFGITAASLDLSLLPAGAAAAAALIAARYAGKAIGVFALARPSGLSLRKASLLSLGLMPMSGVALILARETSDSYPELGPALVTVVLSAIVMLELLGPLLANFAIVHAGEVAEEA
ncbi:MAG: sodium:proton exchanger [Betaproteobacteria bacterium]|nr:MAG: sodium:proton exchanger [Betaproteobacteria bacterium]